MALPQEFGVVVLRNAAPGAGLCTTLRDRGRTSRGRWILGNIVVMGSLSLPKTLGLAAAYIPLCQSGLL
jgi:hypothetical protein